MERSLKFTTINGLNIVVKVAIIFLIEICGRINKLCNKIAHFYVKIKMIEGLRFKRNGIPSKVKYSDWLCDFKFNILLFNQLSIEFNSYEKRFLIERVLERMLICST